MSGKRIVLVGGGGHCRSVIGLFRDPSHELIGVLDPAIVGNVLGIPVLGGDEHLHELAGQGHAFLVTAGHVGDATLRIRLCNAILEAGGTLATVLAPSSTVVEGAVIGEGTTVGHGAVVNSNSRIGTNCIINSRALVEHDAEIGDHVHIATGAIVNGH
ncbi:MAG: acetyltransferase, partial [Flavobacteriales bacterium]|nr:acetyltransferase [Flavobacteriales bacterium]